MEKNTKLLFDEESRKIWKRISAFVGTVLFSCMFFCCTVWAEASYDENLAAHRQTAANTGSICGTLFLGYVYGGVGDNLADDSAYLDYVLKQRVLMQAKNKKIVLRNFYCFVLHQI